MTTLAQVKTKVNNWLTPKWANLVSKQDAYFAANGGYFQGRFTHSTDVDGEAAERVPDKLDDHPTDQVHDWRDFTGNVFDVLSFPCRLQIDVYESPDGHGWSALLQVLYRGTVYERRKGVGPEGRNHDWRKVIDVI